MCRVQVWAEVQHCEERVQLLCTIARAVETHVSILQDELCKAGPLLHIECSCKKGRMPVLCSRHSQYPAELPAGANDEPMKLGSIEDLLCFCSSEVCTTRLAVSASL